MLPTSVISETVISFAVERVAEIVTLSDAPGTPDGVQMDSLFHDLLSSIKLSS